MARPAPTRRTALAAGAAGAAALLAACSGQGGTGTAASGPATTPPDAPTPAAPGSTAATSTAGPSAAGTTSTTTSTTTASALPAVPTAHSSSAADSPWVVVNKQHPLVPRDYAPDPRVVVGGVPVAAAAAPDLRAMVAAAAADGVRLPLLSGYRSYDYQVAVHRSAIARNGLASAEAYSARAGHSEHQTGLAVDVGSASRPSCDLRPCFAETPEAAWLAARAGEHGFLVRYTPATQAVTGYSPEAWHCRWVGAELVAAMAARGVATLEELFGVTGGPDYA